MENIIGVSGDYTLNSLNFKEDKVFRGVVEAISPEKIFRENKEIINSFIDILTEESPIAINMTDIFNKDKSIKSLNALQEQFAQVYLNNFYEVWNKAKSDYRLKHKIENLLKKYQRVGIDVSRENSDIGFFENEQEMYTADRYMMAKTFNEKKGTELAVEYVYKLAWLTDIEGPIRDAYYFDIKSQSCLGLSNGFTICGSSLTDPVPPEPSQEEKNMFPDMWPLPFKNPMLCSNSAAKRIGSFTIADTVDDNTCTKFTYEVEGSIFPEFFEAFVLPLSHPLGFGYIYRKVTSLLFEDYFNLEYIYRCDEIGVRSLCTDGDCSKPLTETYAKRARYDESFNIINPGGGISKSQLKYIDKGIMVEGTYRNWDYEKYTFDNEDYLIQYTYAPPLGKVQQVIEFYDINKNRMTNYVKNPSFDTWYDWNVQLHGNWTIGDGFASFLGKSSVGEEDVYKLTQPISLKKDKNYEIIIKISGLESGENAILRLNERKIYDDNGNLDHIENDQWVLSENIEYNIGYTAYGGEKIQIFTEQPNVDFKIEYINIYINEPNKTYSNDRDQSDIYIINLDVPKLNLFTYDEMVIKTETVLEEDMNSLYYDHISDEDKYPIIGKNMMINDYIFARADITISGEDQLVNVIKHMTVDYVEPTNGEGDLRTRYEAVQDLGLVNLLYENFKDASRWRVLFSNIDIKTEIDEGIANEDAFRIGSKDSVPEGLVIPKGSDNTTYMTEDLSIERDFEAEWIPGINDLSFSNPSKWFMNSEWRIEEFFNTESNYAEIKPRNTIKTTGSTQLVDVQVGTLIEYINDVSGPDIDNTPPFGHKYHVYKSIENRGLIDINKEDFITSPKWVRWRRTVNAEISREIDTDTILNNEIIKIDTIIEPFPEYNQIDDWIELTIGNEGDFIYRFNENKDYWVNIVSGDLVTYQIYKNGELKSEEQYKALSGLGELNLKDENFSDNIRWEHQSNVDNVPKYTYKSNDNNVVLDLSVNMSIDIIKEDYLTRRTRTRFISKTNRSNINLAWEDFNDSNLWEEKDVNDPIRVTSYKHLQWAGLYEPGDKIYFTASPTFRGKITFFNVRVFNKKL